MNRILAAIVILFASNLMGCGPSQTPKEAILDYVHERMIQNWESVEVVEWGESRTIENSSDLEKKESSFVSALTNVGPAANDSLTRKMVITPDSLTLSQEVPGQSNEKSPARLNVQPGTRLIRLRFKVDPGESNTIDQVATRLKNFDHAVYTLLDGRLGTNLVKTSDDKVEVVVERSSRSGQTIAKRLSPSPEEYDVVFVVTPTNRCAWHLTTDFWDFYNEQTAP